MKSHHQQKQLDSTIVHHATTTVCKMHLLYLEARLYSHQSGGSNYTISPTGKLRSVTPMQSVLALAFTFCYSRSAIVKQRPENQSRFSHTKLAPN